ncbi:MAG: hypothetical protein WCF30_15265, partial [Terracidiphilus sp.]
STFRPASTCFSAVIICASVCLLFDINPPSPNTISYSVLCGFWAAAQYLWGRILLDVTASGFEVVELAAGVTRKEIEQRTGASLRFSDAAA